MADLDRYLDGIWCRLVQPDGLPALELRDPNDGHSGDPDDKTRHQYRVTGGWLLLRRALPPTSVGDRWLGDEIDDPWWEPVLELPQGGPLRAYWEQHAEGLHAHEYAWQARHAAGHVALYTPTGRQVRFRDDGYELQPHNDNYWLRCADLPAARRAYFGR